MSDAKQKIANLLAFEVLTLTAESAHPYWLAI
jgi:hypothetical protein